MNIKKKLVSISIAVLALLSIAVVGAYASPSIDLDQCRNGGATSPSNCTGSGSGSVGWANGNAGPSNAHFAEGYSIPYRARMFQVPPNTQVSMVFEYDNVVSSTHAIDYITQFQNLDNPPGSHLLTFGHTAETVFPADTVAFTGPITTIPIPVPDATNSPVDNQPDASFNNLPPSLKIMTLYGGTLTDIKYVLNGSLTAKDSSTDVMVNFTSNATCAPAPDLCTLVLAWGGHIASAADWGSGNSSSAISGSPYHTRLKSWTLGSVGNQDRSLKSTAVVAPSTITIIKNTIPDSEQLFTYSTSITGFSSFSLRDNGTGLNSTSIGGLAAGTYTVQENAVSGYLTNLTCNDPSGGTTVSNSTRTATIGLAQGETVTCTFVNTQLPKLKVNKVLVPSTDTGLFNLQIDGATAGTGANVSDGGTTGTVNESIGTHSVGETAGTGTTLTDYTSAITGDCASDGSVTLAAGDNKVCTITNTVKNATLTIVKNAIPNDEQSFSFTGSDGIGSFKLNDNGTGLNSTTFSLLPGTYSVSETVPTGWNLANATCTDGSAVNAIGLSANESVTCTFTNNATLHLSFIKQGALNFTTNATDYTINVTNDGFANLTIANMTDETVGKLTNCNKAFGVLAVGDSIICSVTNSSINAATIIEVLAETAQQAQEIVQDIFWRV